MPLKLEMLPKISWGFVLLPLNSPWVRRRQGGSGEEPLQLDSCSSQESSVLGLGKDVV